MDEAGAKRHIEDEARQLSWELRILRDLVLKTAEGLPGPDRERVTRISERMMASFDNIRAAIAHTEDGPESYAESLARLRGGMAEVARELGMMARDLQDAVGERSGGEPDLPPASELLH